MLPHGGDLRHLDFRHDIFISGPMSLKYTKLPDNYTDYKSIVKVSNSTHLWLWNSRTSYDHLLTIIYKYIVEHKHNNSR